MYSCVFETSGASNASSSESHPFRVVGGSGCAGRDRPADDLVLPRKRRPAQFLVENFDLASIRSSFGNRRTPAKRTFADFDMAPTVAAEELLEFDDPHWYYGIKVLRRGDFNKDGIEDLEICFVDRAKGGSYNSQKPLLVTRYSAATYAVAINFELDGCEKFAR